MLAFAKAAVALLLTAVVVGASPTPKRELLDRQTPNPADDPEALLRASWAKNLSFDNPPGAAWSLEVKDGWIANGQPVQLGGTLYTPPGYEKQIWVWQSGQLQTYLLNNYEFYCMDAGSPPFYNGKHLKIWKCYPGLAQQMFNKVYIGSYMMIKLANTRECSGDCEY